MIYRKILFCLISFSILGCSLPKEPEFKRMENTLVQKITASEIIILTNAVFHNPNGFGVTVSNINIMVSANDVKSADIAQAEDVDMISDSEFSIPLEIKLKPKELLTFGNILKLIAGSLDKKVKLKYSGNTTLKLMNVGYDIPIDYSEEILLKK